MLAAISKGKIPMVESLPRTMNCSQRVSYLFRAVHHGQCEILQQLLDVGPDINPIDDQGNSLLDIAVASNKLKLIRILVDSGYTTDHLARENLFCLISKGKLDVIKILFGKCSTALWPSWRNILSPHLSQ